MSTPVIDSRAACKTIVYLLRAMGPCKTGDIKEELLDQCIGVDLANHEAIYEHAMAVLHTRHVVDWDSDNCSWDINPIMYNDKNEWAGPEAYDFT